MVSMMWQDGKVGGAIGQGPAEEASREAACMARARRDTGHDDWRQPRIRVPIRIGACPPRTGRPSAARSRLLRCRCVS